MRSRTLRLGATLLAVILFVAGCERDNRTEAPTSPQFTLTADQLENLGEAGADFASAFEAGVESGDLDPDRELIVVMKDAGARPAAAEPRLGPGSVQVFRADAGVADTRTQLGFASASTESRAAVRNILDAYGLTPEWEGRALPALSVVVPEDTDLAALSTELLQSPNVDYMHANRGSGAPDAGPLGDNDADAKHDMHNVQRAWDDTRGGGEVVYVLDSGLALDSDSTQHGDGQWLTSPFDHGIRALGFVDDYSSDCTTNKQSYGGCKVDDDDGHGTKMVGLVAQNDNDIWDVGVAPRVEAVSAKIAQDCVISGGCGGNDDYHIEEDDYLAALDHISALNPEPAAVSMSYSGQWSSSIDDAIVDLRDVEDIVVLTSTGNDSGDCGEEPQSIAETTGVGGVMADTTNYGCSTYENLSAYADDTTNDKPRTLAVDCPTWDYCMPDNSTIGTTCCTSAATAIAAGLVALVRDEYPTWSALDVESELHDHSFGGVMDVIDLEAVFDAH